MIHEPDAVALTRDDPESGPEAGDVGRVVFRYGSGEAFEVEFLAGDGSTLAVQTLEQDRSRPPEGTDLSRVRRDSAV